MMGQLNELRGLMYYALANIDTGTLLDSSGEPMTPIAGNNAKPV